MDIYLAARFDRQDELRGYRHQLEQRGHIVTSRWLDEDKVVPTDDMDRHFTLRQMAMMDVEDLMNAEWLISFTEEPTFLHVRGSRHVEFGMAWKAGLTCFVVGPRENIFHHLDGVNVHPDWESFLRSLR